MLNFYQVFFAFFLIYFKTALKYNYKQLKFKVSTEEFEGGINGVISRSNG